MATRSTIAVQREDGTVAQVYCHWDGYLDNNGQLLVKHYTDPAKVEALLAEGDISSLGAEIGQRHQFSQFEAAEPGIPTYEEAEKLDWCNFYGRDRGESGTAARVFKDVEAYEKAGDDGMFEEFNYLFIGNRWYYKSYDGLVRDVEKQLVWDAVNQQEAA